jgi:hypothetical protein
MSAEEVPVCKLCKSEIDTSKDIAYRIEPIGSEEAFLSPLDVFANDPTEAASLGPVIAEVFFMCGYCLATAWPSSKEDFFRRAMEGRIYPGPLQ